jgi:hypothetical protein
MIGSHPVYLMIVPLSGSPCSRRKNRLAHIGYRAQHEMNVCLRYLTKKADRLLSTNLVGRCYMIERPVSEVRTDRSNGGDWGALQSSSLR